MLILAGGADEEEDAALLIISLVLRLKAFELAVGLGGEALAPAGRTAVCWCHSSASVVG